MNDPVSGEVGDSHLHENEGVGESTSLAGVESAEGLSPDDDDRSPGKHSSWVVRHQKTLALGFAVVSGSVAMAISILSYARETPDPARVVVVQAALPIEQFGNSATPFDLDADLAVIVQNIGDEKALGCDVWLEVIVQEVEHLGPGELVVRPAARLTRGDDRLTVARLDGGETTELTFSSALLDLSSFDSGTNNVTSEVGTIGTSVDCDVGGQDSERVTPRTEFGITYVESLPLADD